MDSNTHSIETAEGLTALAAAVDRLATEDLGVLSDGVRAERVLVLRRLVDRLDGQWLRELADLDARGAAGADQDQPAASTASWLRARLRMGPTAATSCVRTARALFRGPLTATAQALTGGEISPAHATALAAGTNQLPYHTTVKAEPVLVEAARRLDPPRLRRVLGHVQEAVDPDGAQDRADRHHSQRWLRVDPTFDGMVAIDGLLEPEAGHTLMAALEPLARPADAQDTRSAGQRHADGLWELARRALEGGRLPQTGGIRPQLTVIVDLDSLLGHPGAVGGDTGWAGPLAPEACRRLACDGVVTRVLITRHPPDHPHPSGQERSAAPRSGGTEDLAGWLRTAIAKLPLALGGALPGRWRSGGPAESSPRPNAPPWPSATAAASSPIATGPFPGASRIICATGCTAAPPTSTTWPSSAGPIIGPSMREAGGWLVAPMGGPPPHPGEHPGSRPDRSGRKPTASRLATLLSEWGPSQPEDHGFYAPLSR